MIRILMDYDIVYSASKDAAAFEEADEFLRISLNIKFKCGKKIFEKIKAALQDDPMSGRKKFDPFNMWNGRNFIINMKNVAGYNNYDDSKFAESSSALLEGNDQLLETIWRSEHSLKDFVDPTKVLKPYDQLKAKLEEVLEGMSEYRAVVGNQGTSTSSRPSTNSTSKFNTSKPVVKSNAEDSPFEDNSEESEDSESALNYYKRLASEE